MKLTNLQRYSPEELHMGDGIQYFKDEAGEDWFKSLAKFSKKYALAIVESSGVICAIATDPSRLYPAGLSVVEVDELPEGIDNDSLGEWVFDGENVVARSYTSAELQEQASKTQTKLLASANSTISIWQTELLLGTINDRDRAQLVEWVTYIKALKSVNVTTAPDIEWPTAPAE
ncbi:tail fiber assembly protein [Rouxiella badensis]|nr:tail fiber assembly protein [Rouxiella badensis]